MGKRYESVLGMVKSLSSEEALKELFPKIIKEKSLGKYLFLLRCEHGLSQKELASIMGCTQSRISKIESAYDQEITIKDLLDYAKALKLKLEIGYRHPSVKLIDLIKYHAFKIRGYLNQLRVIAKDDEKLQEGIAEFHVEALFNLCKMVADSLTRMKFVQKAQRKEEQSIHFSAPFEKLKVLNVNEGNKAYCK